VVDELGATAVVDSLGDSPIRWCEPSGRTKLLPDQSSYPAVPLSVAEALDTSSIGPAPWGATQSAPRWRQRTTSLTR